MTNPTQALTQPQLLQTIISLLTAAKTPQLQPLKPYIPYLTQPLLLSILRSKALANKPSTLLSFFQWAQAHNPSLTQTPHPLLALLHPLLCHHKYPRQNPARPIHRRRSPKRAPLGSSAPGRHRSKALKSPSGYFHRGLSPLWKAPPCSPAVQENEAASFTTQLAHLQYSALCSGKARFV
ncbi:pentatricopeptide repeat-containing protein [Prunus yedoensis var. nudiflora]|uniref:Pentatricopeptide repeat-containing protein n=1 Tax=Prunus yedoensis var. nudiflora TaxID=2094558 RepID=A0A314ZMG4_PRUYE|nr:pentatricopeptide repeat-containing protein [Prunus yedoensis var. nudiflora]